MKGQWKRGGHVVAVLLTTALAGLAQTTATAHGAPGQMAHPGSVNYVEGQAMLEGQAISATGVGSTVIAPNQVIDTADGYVEVLLTPGAFLRMGHNSEVRLLSAGLTDVNLELEHGSAMIEVADFVKGSRLELRMNGATTEVEHKGLYAFDAEQRSVRVLDGKVEVVQNEGQTTLKKGDEVLLASDKPLKKRDFEAKTAQAEPLYVWSKVRSQSESQANENLANTIARNGGGYGAGWYWNPFWANYAFLPGAGMLYSPFGWSYYSPAFVYGYGFSGHGYYGHPYYRYSGRVGGVTAGVRSYHGGGFHGGGGRR